MIGAACTDDSYTYPPRGLSREEAARYIGVDAPLFDHLVAHGQMPRPKRIGTYAIWDRIKLDLAFAELGNEDDGDRRARGLAEQPQHYQGTRRHDVPLRYGPREMLEKFGLISEADFATLLGITVKTLQNKSALDLPRSVKVSGRQRLFEVNSVRAYLEARREPQSFEDDVSFSRSIRRSVKKVGTR